MNSGSRDGQMEGAARELSPAYRVHEPGRRAPVPPSAGHLAPAPQLPFLDVTAPRGRRRRINPGGDAGAGPGIACGARRRCGGG